MDSGVDAFASGVRSNGSSNRGIASGAHNGPDVLLLRLAQAAALVLEEPVHARGAVLRAADPQLSGDTAHSPIGDVAAPRRRILFVAVRNYPHTRLSRRRGQSRRREEDPADCLVGTAARALAAIHGDLDSDSRDVVCGAWRAEMRRLFRPLDRNPGVVAVCGWLRDRRPSFAGRDGEARRDNVQALSCAYRADHHSVPVARQPRGQSYLKGLRTVIIVMKKEVSQACEVADVGTQLCASQVVACSDNLQRTLSRHCSDWRNQGIHAAMQVGVRSIG